MDASNGHMIIAPGTHIIGQIRGGERVEIAGSAEGSIVTRHLVITEGGAFQGNLKVETVEVHGRLRGTASVRHLISVSGTGDVEGDIEYGQLALQAGSNFVADVRNVPPELAGDFELEIDRGGTAPITPADLKATDAEDGAGDLRFTPSNLLNGYVAMAAAPNEPVGDFTQADVDAGRVVFVHSGSETLNAGFDVQVSDAQGATAGPPRPVLVKVRSGSGSGAGFGEPDVAAIAGDGKAGGGRAGGSAFPPPMPAGPRMRG